MMPVLARVFNTLGPSRPPCTRAAAEPARYCTDTWVTSAAYVIFYASAIAASIGAGLFLTRIIRFPYGWLTLLLALLVGTIFGLVMFSRFLTLRGVPER